MALFIGKILVLAKSTACLVHGRTGMLKRCARCSESDRCVRTRTVAHLTGAVRSSFGPTEDRARSNCAQVPGRPQSSIARNPCAQELPRTRQITHWRIRANPSFGVRSECGCWRWPPSSKHRWRIWSGDFRLSSVFRSCSRAPTPVLVVTEGSVLEDLSPSPLLKDILH